MLFHQRATPEEEEEGWVGGRGPGRDAQSPNWLEQTSIAGVHSSVQLNFNYNYILYCILWKSVSAIYLVGKEGNTTTISSFNFLLCTLIYSTGCNYFEEQFFSHFVKHLCEQHK